MRKIASLGSAVMLLMVASIGEAQRARSATGNRSTRPAAPPPSNFRIGEIQLIPYNVGHELMDSTGKAMPLPKSPVDGFTNSSESPHLTSGIYNVPMLAFPSFEELIR